MRKLISLPLFVTVVAATLVVVASPSRAHHRPNTYCSKSGDLCHSVRRVDGVRRLTITLEAKYFTTFHLCVLDPDGYEICEPFRIRKRPNGTFARRVGWRRYFPSGGPGAYAVTWWAGQDRVGRKLGFHIK